MIRKRRALGLGLAVAIALIAAAAPAAHAEPQFTSSIEIEETTLTLEQLPLQPNGFTLAKKAPFSCKTVTYHGVMNDHTDATLTPFYDECEMYKAPASITGFEIVEGPTPCDWHIYAAGGVDLKCKTGKDVEIHTSVCRITIQPQNGLKSLSYKKVPGHAHYNLTWSVTGIVYEYIGGFSCEIVSGVQVGVPFNDGVYEGTATIEAHDAKTGTEVEFSVDE